MRQPKYNFGDKFTKHSNVSVEGSIHNVEVVHYIVGIRATATDTGFSYYYTLGEMTPSEYQEPKWTTDPIEETKMLEVYEVWGCA